MQYANEYTVIERMGELYESIYSLYKTLVIKNKDTKLSASMIEHDTIVFSEIKKQEDEMKLLRLFCNKNKIAYPDEYNL